MHLNWLRETLPYIARSLTIGSECVNKQSWNFTSD